METPSNKSISKMMMDFDFKRDSIVDYANICQRCFQQLVIRGSVPSEILRRQLVSHFEGLEDYKSCSKILNLPIIDEPLTVEETLIHEHEIYLKDCYEVFNEFGRLSFYGRPKEHGLKLIDSILEYLSLNAGTAKILQIALIRDELERKGCGSGKYYVP